jgi:hypothetical protein
MIASREYKDSIMNSFNFIKGAHIPAAIFGTETESYMSPDSSKFIDLAYKDSAIVSLGKRHESSKKHNFRRAN